MVTALEWLMQHFMQTAHENFFNCPCSLITCYTALMYIDNYADTDYFYHNKKVETFDASRYKCRVFHDL